MKHATPRASTGYEIRFLSLFHGGRALSFPCDCQGRVDMDALAPHAKRNYLYARAMIGREFGWPDVVARDGADVH